MDRHLSVIICTYNRSSLLSEALESLEEQTVPLESFEVIIVDNNSPDDTHDVAQAFCNKNRTWRYCREEKTGLSYARNAGYKSACYKWVAYVEDDAKMHRDFVETAVDTINNENFDCFGGIYNAWFKYGKPKWIPVDFGTNRDRMPDMLSILTEKSFSGGVAVYRKEILELVGGFPVDMGMQGDKIAYGEENYVQDRARELGYRVGFNPNLQIDHLVRQEKLKKSWHYQDAYQKGISRARLQQDTRIDRNILKYGILELFKYPIRFILNRSTFMGNRNMMYYFGYFSQLRKQR